MTTTITPASGQGALFTQQGPGTTPGYSALDDRRSNSGSLQEGVYGTSTLVTAGGVSSVVAADFMATQRAAGANMSVDVNMPAGGFAFVQGDTINGQGLYCVPVHSGNINEVIAGSDATNPRIDQIILEIQDNVLDASGGNLARTRVLTGTPTGGATLTNRTGALALPGSALLLADVLVPAASSSVPNANIRDRRKWARGAFTRIVRTAGNYTTTATSQTQIDSANLNPRVECSGAPVRVTLHGWGSVGIANIIGTGLQVDGVGVDSTTDLTQVTVPAGTNPTLIDYTYVVLAAAGSHLFAPTFRTGANTATIEAVTGSPLVFTVEELARSNAQNSNGVTSG